MTRQGREGREDRARLVLLGLRRLLETLVGHVLGLDHARLHRPLQAHSQAVKRPSRRARNAPESVRARYAQPGKPCVEAPSAASNGLVVRGGGGHQGVRQIIRGNPWYPARWVVFPAGLHRCFWDIGVSG